MKTLTLRANDTVSDKFAWHLEHFSLDEIKILEQDEYVDDYTYLRTINDMITSILDVRNEPASNGVTLDKQKDLNLITIIQKKPYQYPPEHEYFKGDMQGLISR